MSSLAAQLTGEIGTLSAALRDGCVDFFIGSGASKAANLKSWDDLIYEMTDEIRNRYQGPAAEIDNFLSSADHLETAEAFRTAVGEFEYYKFLRERFRRDVPLSRIHHELRRWPVKTIFTTNWDHLLEKTFRPPKGIEPPSVVFPKQLGYVDQNGVRIVKLHGDIDHPESIVFTRSDYAVYARRHQDFERELSSSINNRTLLFVGFGLRDQNFSRIFNDARSFYDRTKRDAYAIMVDTTSITRDMWRKDGLRIVPAKGYNNIPAVLKRIRIAAGVGT